MEEMIPAASINQEDRSELGVRDMEYGCCCFELLFDNIVVCADGHLFCFRCQTVKQCQGQEAIIHAKLLIAHFKGVEVFDCPNPKFLMQGSESRTIKL